MAGSYNDIVNKDGSLKSDMVIDLMFEDGDYVVDTIKELYGMIWYLAYVLNVSDVYGNAKDAVEEARTFYEEGLKISPSNLLKE